MTTSKHTKRAFLSSLLALLLCFSMLVGTTFAWFKDGVVSGKNQIVAGNLDVTLQHAAMVNGTFEALEDVDSTTTDLFTKSTTTSYNLWEPGAMAIEEFMVTNVGTVALKYSLDLNALTDGDYNTVTWDSSAAVEAGTYNLTGILKVAVTNTKPTSRETALANNFVELGDLTSGKVNLQREILLPASTEATAENPSTHTFYVILYWEPTISAAAGNTDNIYNLKNGKLAEDGTTTLFIKPSVTLLATQAQIEKDSFGSDYDAGAESDVLPAVASTTPTEP